MEKEKGFQLPCRSPICGVELMPGIPLSDAANQHCSTVATGQISPVCVCVCVCLHEETKREREVTENEN